MPMTAIIGPTVFFTGKPMLVDIMRAIIDPLGFCTGKPVQVESMLSLIYYFSM